MAGILAILVAGMAVIGVGAVMIHNSPENRARRAAAEQRGR